MRRRLVLSTLAVVVVVMVVLLAPVLVVVNAAARVDEQNGLYARIAIIAVFALAAAGMLAAVPVTDSCPQTRVLCPGKSSSYESHGRLPITFIDSCPV